MRNKEHKFLPICFSLDFRRNYQTAMRKTIIITEHTGRPVIIVLVAPKTKILLFQTSPSQTRQTQKAKLGGPTPIQTQEVDNWPRTPVENRAPAAVRPTPQTLSANPCLLFMKQNSSTRWSMPLIPALRG